MKAYVYALIALMLSGAVLTACDTTEGFGKDVQNTGKDISQSAQDNK
jgi:predicted small secreted protein